MRTPAYVTVYDTIKKWIIEEKYKVDDMIPPEPALERIFDVSRTTIRKAVEMLIREGLLATQPGIGTFVLDYKTFQNLNTITSFTETLKKRGHEVSLKSIHISRVVANEMLARKLNVEVGAPLAHVQRISCASGTPIAIIKNYIPYHLVPDIEHRTHEIRSLYAFLEEQYKITIETARDRIFARNASFEQAEVLGVRPDFALICVDRLCYAKSKPIIYDILTIRSDMYEFDVSLYRENL